MIKQINRLYLLVTSLAILSGFSFSANAAQVFVPNTASSISTGSTYCTNAAASPIVFTFNVCNAGTGTLTGISFTVNWYKNTSNSNSGGTLVASRTRTVALTATDTVNYTPATSVGGILYYYCELVWAGAGTCNTSGLLTSSTSNITTLGIPSIASVSPLVGYPSSSVTITGTNFNTTAANNIVWFGATRATVTTASATSLTVTVPTGATCRPVTVSDTSGCGLIAFSKLSYLPNFNNSGYLSGVNFSPQVAISTGTSPQGIAIGDIDGDGKSDIAVANSSSSSVYVYRNISSSGSLSSGSFASFVSLTTATGPVAISIGDLDGDGKPELAVTNFNSSSVSVFKNNSTTGTIAFATKIDFSAGAGAYGIDIADVDLDGKSEIVVANYGAATFSVLRNMCTKGSINTGSFATPQAFATSSGSVGIQCADIDGDGKPDMAVSCYGAASLLVFRNTSTMGSISSSSFGSSVSFTTGTAPSGVAVGDLDGDGKTDIVVANESSNNLSLFRNTSTSGTINSGSLATAVNVTTGSGPGFPSIGDIDGDGKMDIAVNNSSSGTVSVFRNTSSSGAISMVARVDFGVGINSRSTTMGDLDGDGKADIIATNGASYTISVLRNNPLSPIAGAGVVCLGSTRTLTDSATGGTWSSSATSIATVNSTTGVVTAVTAGTAIITYAVTGGSDTALVTVNPIPVLTVTPVAASYCNGSSTSITASGASTYSWSPATGLSATTGATVTCTATSTTTYTVTGTSGAGCVGTRTQTITVNPIPVLTVTPVAAAYCNGSSTNITASGASTYSWSPATGLSASTGATVTCNATSTTTYTVTGTSGAGCVGTRTQTITVNPIPVLTVTPVAAAYCNGSSTNITASGASTYSWSPATGLSASTGATVTCNATSTTTYTVTCTNAMGCVGTNTQTITVGTTTPTITVTPGTAATICIGSSITASGATTYTWSPSTGLSATTGAVVTTTASGAVTYTVTGSTSGCSATSTNTYTVIPAPVITNVTPLLGNNGTSVTITGTNFNATAGKNRVWFGATNVLGASGSSTSLTVSAPVGATYKPVSITDTATGCGLSGYAQYPYLPTFDTTPYISGVVNIDARVNFSTGTQPWSLAIGDLDGDGKVDIAAANQVSNTVSVFRNTSSSGSLSSGSFATKVDFATGTTPRFVAIGDLDGDGKADLAVANGASNTVSVLRNTSSSGSIVSGSFATKVDFTTGTNPYSVAIGDLDGDGKADLAVANANSNSVSAIRNTSSMGSISSGSFAAKVDFTTGTNPYSVAIGDLDGDGKADLAVANNGSTYVSVFQNTSSSGSLSTGSFAAKVDFTTGVNSYCVAIGDLDGDGKADLAVANQSSNTVSVIRNTSSSGSINSGSFATKVDFTTGFSPSVVAIGDLTGDSKPDLVVVNVSPATLSVIRNRSSSGSISSGSFATRVDFPTGSTVYSLAIGDLDGDGKADLALANFGNNTVSVYRNNPLTPIGGAGAVCVGYTRTLNPDFAVD